MRNGAPFEAITLYSKIMTEFPIYGLLEQVNLLYKDEPVFLQEMMMDLDDDDAYDRANSFANDHNDSFALQQIANFDKILGKACQICLLDELDIEERQKGWF